MLSPGDPDRGASKGQIHVDHPGAVLHPGDRLALGAEDLADYLLDADLGHGPLALVVKDSGALQSDDGVADVVRIDKDGGARKGFVFLHSLRSYRFPRRSCSQVDFITGPAVREPQTPLKAEEPVYQFRGNMHGCPPGPQVRFVGNALAMV